MQVLLIMFFRDLLIFTPKPRTFKKQSSLFFKSSVRIPPLPAGRQVASWYCFEFCEIKSVRKDDCRCKDKSGRFLRRKIRLCLCFWLRYFSGFLPAVSLLFFQKRGRASSCLLVKTGFVSYFKYFFPFSSFGKYS